MGNVHKQCKSVSDIGIGHRQSVRARPSRAFPCTLAPLHPCTHKNSPLEAHSRSEWRTSANRPSPNRSVSNARAARRLALTC